MNDSLLYFPYINIPKNSWAISSVLYWDNVGVIVPDVYRDNPGRLQKNMLDMVQAELVQQIFPYHYVQNIPNFDSSFLNLIHHADFDLAQKQRDFSFGKTSRLHVQKFGEGLLDGLENIAIARRESWDWYHVEQKTASLFMTYLATIIGKIEGFTPATDRVSQIDLRLQSNRISYYHQRTRSKFLNDLLPYPVEADPFQLREFKDTYKRELKSFRNKLEQTIVEITAIDERQQREHLYQLKLQEIYHRRDEIYARLTESRFNKIAFGTLFGLTGAGVGLATGHTLWGGFAFANAVHSAFQGYDQRDLLEKDFAYLALIDRQYRFR